ncbi:transglycosylase SLT domain-containing protein [Yoonia sp. 208BN28-4]|uniref:transglycosylase SLT domain-containing protein n=1 Tax=Yoonia sp. 208BN28-4 TaxID=3126505 RepID=UPI0030A590E0
MAEPLIRPFAREDAATLRIEAEAARLAAFRAVARPAHMIRYPVAIETSEPAVRPQARQAFLPRTRWAFQPNSAVWTRAAMSAIGGHGDGLDSLVPRDIDRWCPSYQDNPPHLRRAFWVGMMSALAKHESTYNPRAVGGGNLWFGLLQIYPDTARRYGCRARTGDALKNPVENLSCAARIMNVTVARDNAIAVFDRRWRGVAADWGPMSNRNKIPEMANWTRQQSYCVARDNIRPQARPAGLSATVSTRTVALND